jgi:hypothetical protein
MVAGARSGPGPLPRRGRRQAPQPAAAPVAAPPHQRCPAPGRSRRMVCDLAHEELAEATAVHWSIPDPVPAGATRWADPSSATYPTSKLPGTSDTASSSARPAARALTRTSSGTAPRQTGNDTQSRSEHPQDHPQSKPEHRNLGAERTVASNSGWRRRSRWPALRQVDLDTRVRQPSSSMWQFHLGGARDGGGPAGRCLRASMSRRGATVVTQKRSRFEPR